MLTADICNETIAVRGDGQFAYRGLNDKQMSRLAPCRKLICARLLRTWEAMWARGPAAGLLVDFVPPFVVPEELPDPTDIWTLLSGEPQGQVLGKKRKHYRSFSLCEKTAIAYATRNGGHDGWLLHVCLPHFKRGTQSDAVAHWVGTDETEWVDPRFVPPPPMVVMGFGATGMSQSNQGQLINPLASTEAFHGWTKMRQLACRDNELLLARGAIHLGTIRRVHTREFDSNYTTITIDDPVPRKWG
jgi:hypothetical protein